jgi:Lon protease-like protein
MAISELPLQLPLLNVYGAVVFSDTQLPLPMTEEQYETILSLSEKTNFVIGIVQPKNPEGTPMKGCLPIFRSGTAVQLNGANEYDDRLVIVQVKGLCRFSIEDEFMIDNKFRYAKVSYNKYIYADSIPSKIEDFDRSSFTALMKSFMHQRGVRPNWHELEAISPQELINFVTMIGPLEASEKQAILEQTNPNDQKYLLEKIMTMSLTDTPSTLSILKH